MNKVFSFISFHLVDKFDYLFHIYNNNTPSSILYNLECFLTRRFYTNIAGNDMTAAAFNTVYRPIFKLFYPERDQNIIWTLRSYVVVFMSSTMMLVFVPDTKPFYRI